MQFRIASDPPPRLDRALSRDAPQKEALSRSRLTALLQEGRVLVNGEIAASAKAKPREGDLVEIRLPPPAWARAVPQDIPINVVYEDDDVVVVDKTAEMVVHPARGNPDGTLANALLAHCGGSLSGIRGERRPGIVHRIDKGTSGLLVAAKSDAAHLGLSAQFRAHSVERRYLAVVRGVPDVSDPRLAGVAGAAFEPGNVLRIETLLDRHPIHRKRQAVFFDHGKRAVTRAKVAERFGDPPALSLLECWLETGRTHQIRVHMSHAGHGLLGDPVYGTPGPLSAAALGQTAAQVAGALERQALHAAVLGFEHPVRGGFLRFESPLPEDFSGLLDALRAGRGGGPG